MSSQFPVPSSEVPASGTGNWELGTGNFTILLESPGRPGWANMSRDQAMLDLAERTGQSFLRLYTWQPHAISFGRHEAALRRYDQAAIRRSGVDVVRRPTGGRAVWHADELTYAVAAPLATYGMLAAAYRAIHEVVRTALGRLGLELTLAERQSVPGMTAGACFSAPVGGEIICAGRKLVGSAQLRQRDVFLQHGSILLGGSQGPLENVSRGAGPPTGETSLGTVLRRRVTADEVATLILAEFGGMRGDPDCLDATAGIHESRFRSEEWTWRR